MAVIEIFDMDEEQTSAEINHAPIIRAKRSPRKKTDTADTADMSGGNPAGNSEARPVSGSDQADQAQPKKRGRPKKDRAEAENGAAPSGRGSKNASASMADGEDAVQKTRRGRSKKPADPAAPDNAGSLVVATGESNAQAEKKPSRGRGRSPKVTAENGGTGTADGQNSNKETAGKKLSAESSGRRSGEGRGRKFSAKTIDDSQNADSNAADIAQPQAPLAVQAQQDSPPSQQLAITGVVSRPQLPFVEFSPTEHALAMSLSILPAVEPPLSLVNADRPQDEASADADRPSKSRSRSARRRRAAARRKAEAASDQTDDVQDDADELEELSADGNDLGDDVEISSREAEQAESAVESAAESEADVESDRESAAEFHSESHNAAATAESADEAADRAPESGRTGRSRSRGQSRRKKNREPRMDDKPADQAVAHDDDDDDEDLYLADTPTTARSADRKMLVSVLPGELVEVVVFDSGKVQEYYVEMEHQAKIRGNIYKGIVSNIDVNLQAAFINFGGIKNGFLQIDEVHPEYWLTHHESTKGHKHPPIQKVMKPGQEVLVQVVKEPSGSKGAFLTTWVSLAGRFLVLTPGQEQIGISRKVEDGEERNRLRELIKGLSPGEGLGAIVRTVSAGTSKTTLQKDLSFLKRVWKDIRKRAGTEKTPCLIYKEPSLATRAVRDYLSDDVSEVWVDDADTAEAIREMTGLLFPRKADLLHIHQDVARTLWERFKVTKSLEQIHAREVILPSGGRLVFDQTEALMAIDINSGKTGGKTNFESMAQRTNMEAAEMIAHQLRLRDVGGQVVIDFIEMRDQSHVREVEKTMRNAMKLDRARYDIGKMSSFGLMQIVRQRIGSSAISISQEACPHCQGTGLRRNMEWQSLQQLRDLKVQMRNAAQAGNTEYTLALEAELALYMLNHKRDRLSALEKEYGIQLVIRTLVS